MFTILHKKDGTDQFYSVESAIYHGPFSSGPVNSTEGYRLELLQPSTNGLQPPSTVELFGGTVYVMNATGATVGKYVLDNAKYAAGKIGGPSPDRFPLGGLAAG